MSAVRDAELITRRDGALLLKLRMLTECAFSGRVRAMGRVVSRAGAVLA
jgi:hypothetical protein